VGKELQGPASPIDAFSGGLRDSIGDWRSCHRCYGTSEHSFLRGWLDSVPTLWLFVQPEGANVLGRGEARHLWHIPAPIALIGLNVGE
jgi:hypothetical protein